MLFYVDSIKYGWCGLGDKILQAYPNIANCRIEEVKTQFGLKKKLIVELNSAEDFLKFVKEVETDVIIRHKTDDEGNVKPSLLICDDYM